MYIYMIFLIRESGMGLARTAYIHNTVIYTTHINLQPKLINDTSPNFVLSNDSLC